MKDNDIEINRGIALLRILNTMFSYCIFWIMMCIYFLCSTLYKKLFVAIPATESTYNGSC